MPMNDIAKRDDETLYFEKVYHIDFYAKIARERRRLARNSIIAGTCVAVPLAFL
jgi:hypothetical protein